jgi:hypothetical protein
MVLQNGSFHVVETVDATGDESSFRKTITEIAMSALILERARMKFGEPGTNSKLVYVASSFLEKIARPSLDAAEHQGAELVNWSSTEDRISLIRSFSALAIRISKNKKIDIVAPQGKDFFH